ncbi:MAG: hypothetical protein MK106_08190 [Mariniblastus sp.]|nr:hypothetical protein [Mariniblastus sp.]
MNNPEPNFSSFNWDRAPSPPEDTQDRNANPSTTTKSRSRSKGCLLTFVGLALMAAGLVWLALEAAQKVPEFYAKALAIPLESAARDGDQLEMQLASVQRAARRGVPWKVEFTEAQINGWVVADLPNKFPTVLPKKMKNPRIHFQPHRAQLAFQFQSGGIEGVVIAECDFFCTDVPNQMALQIVSVKSGFIPLPIGPWIDRLTQSAERAGIPILWANRDGDPVALFTLPDDLVRFGDTQMVIIQAIKIKSGSILIAGSTTQYPSLSDPESPSE